MTIQTNRDELERQKFERWAKCRGWSLKRSKFGDYEDQSLQYIWIGWLARSNQE